MNLSTDSAPRRRAQSWRNAGLLVFFAVLGSGCQILQNEFWVY